MVFDDVDLIVDDDILISDDKALVLDDYILIFDFVFLIFEQDIEVFIEADLNISDIFLFGFYTIDDLVLMIHMSNLNFSTQ